MRFTFRILDSDIPRLQTADHVLNRLVRNYGLDARVIQVHEFLEFGRLGVEDRLPALEVNGIIICTRSVLTEAFLDSEILEKLVNRNRRIVDSDKKERQVAEIKDLNDGNYSAAVEEIEKGLVLFHKKLCPHCKNMEKVMEKFSVKKPGVPLFRVDSEECLETMNTLGLEKVPSLVIVKKGVPAKIKLGLMNPRELLAMYDAT